MGGGDMIERVTVDGSTWAVGPRKFEAGTPPIAEAIAFGVAIDFLNAIGIERVEEFEATLFEKLFEQFQREAGVTVYGPATTRGPQASILSFNVEGVHPHDLGTIADSYNVQLRAGHHCAMPAMKRLGIPSTARVSLGVHSDEDDFEAALVAIRAARKMFG
jgi:cysteine desulfurase/selenocysteine lyase